MTFNSFVMIVNVLILISFGWLKDKVKNLHILNSITIFLIAELIFSNFYLNLLFIRINIGIFIIPLVFVLYLLFFLDNYEKIKLLSLSFLLGTFIFFLKELFLAEPILLKFPEFLQLALINTLIVLIITNDWDKRVFVLVFSFLITDALFFFYKIEYSKYIYLGSNVIQDATWVSLWLLGIMQSVNLKLFRKSIYR